MRILMNIAAGEPPRPVDPGAVRRAARRRTAAYAVTAAAAIVLAGSAGVALATPSARQSPALTGGAATGAPRYYIEQSHSRAGLSQPRVRATATGAVTAAVRCPWKQPAVSVTAMAPARSMSFFIACERTADQGGKQVIKGSRLYRFWISRSGRPQRFTAVRGGELPGLRVTAIAAARDGSEIAVTAVPAATPASVPSIVVISTATGAHAEWHVPPKVPGKVWYSAGSLSLTGDGRELVFLARPRCVRGMNAPPCRSTGGEQVRALSPADRGGLITSSRLLLKQARIMRISLDYINAAVISPDGSTVTLAVVGGKPGPRGGYVRIEQVPASTGTHPRVVYQMNTGNGFSYNAFSADASGRFFLLDAGPPSGSVNGWIDHGKLVRLKPVGGDSVELEVW